jgi:hypothetical protein
LRVLYPFANDQKGAEDVLGALIEPIRNVFRMNLKLGDPIHIARARVVGGSWLWSVVNNTVYRTLSLRLAVREKYAVSFNA